MDEQQIRERIEDRQQFVSDFYHEIAQPLTTLRGVLELALRRPMKVEEYRDLLRRALEASERLERTAAFLRERVEADDPGTIRCEIDLGSLLRTVAEEFLPVAHSRAIVLECLVGDDIRIEGDEERIAKAVFLLFDGILQGSRENSLVALRAKSVEAEIEVRAAYECTAKNESSHSMQIAERMFAAAGARVESSVEGEKRSLVIKMSDSANRARPNGKNL